MPDDGSAQSKTMQWKLTNAWPTQFSGADLKSDGNEVAVHSLELAFERSASQTPSAGP